MKGTLMDRIMILSLAVLTTIGGTNVVSSETIQKNSIEASVLQLYHRKFDVHRRLAAAALARGDVEAAADAATCANTTIFDGVAARFTPSADGVTVLLRKVEERKPFQQVQLTLPQFNDWLVGSAGQYDNVMEKGTPNILQQVATGGGKPIEQQALTQLPQLPIQSCVPRAPAKVIGTSQATGMSPTLRAAQAPAPTTTSVRNKTPQVPEDEQPGRVVRRPYQEPEFYGKLTEEQKREKRSYAMFPGAYLLAEQNAKREAWLAEQEQKAIENEINRSKPLLFPVGGR
jgi:hypothetical protein